MATIRHITQGVAGLHADDSADLAQAITHLTTAGYEVTEVEDDPSEPWHVATISYRGGPQTLRTLQTLIKASSRGQEAPHDPTDLV